MDEVTVVEVQPIKVVGMRKRGKYMEIANMIAEVYHYMMEQGAQPMGPPIYVGHEVSEEEVAEADKTGNADLEVTAPFEGDIVDSEEIKAYELPGGKMAKIVFIGPYQECNKAYEKLFEWMDQNNKHISGPVREVYLNDPREVSQQELITEIYIPVE